MLQKVTNVSECFLKLDNPCVLSLSIDKQPDVRHLQIVSSLFALVPHFNTACFQSYKIGNSAV